MPYGTDDAELEALAHEVIGAAIEVHRVLGPGLKEEVYRNALCIELDARGIPYERSKEFKVEYRGRFVGKGRIDLLVRGILVLELKAVIMLVEAHRGQALYYLRACNLKLGLLMNFHAAVMKDGIKRVVN